jgi:DNA segregation ATPase FtsK/SpoIIIE, S-DNA-T family
VTDLQTGGRKLALPAAPDLPEGIQGEGIKRMRSKGTGAVTGEQFAQVNNPDPFAPPVWRSPVYRTPEWVIWIVQLARLLGRVIWFVICHPLLDTAAGLVILDWLNLGWPGLAGLAAPITGVLVVLRLARPVAFARFVAQPARDGWRWWCYRRRWHAVMTITGLAPVYQGRVLLPVLADVTAAGPVDRVTVRLVSGQSPADFANRAEGIAHGFGVHLCRVRTSSPGVVVLELVRRDALADPVPVLPIPEDVDLAGVPVGRCEDGTPWLLRLLGSHVLIAGATGAGKGSVIWSLIRALLPGIVGGWVQVWACDPKRMELSFGRDLFAPLRRPGRRDGGAAGNRGDRDARPGRPVRREDTDVRGIGGGPVPGGRD